MSWSINFWKGHKQKTKIIGHKKMIFTCDKKVYARSVSCLMPAKHALSIISAFCTKLFSHQSSRSFKSTMNFKNDCLNILAGIWYRAYYFFLQSLYPELNIQ